MWGFMILGFKGGVGAWDFGVRRFVSFLMVQA